MVAEARTHIADRQQFQQLKTRLHERMVDAIDMSKAGQLNEDELQGQLHSLATHICSLEAVDLPSSDRNVMVEEIMNEIYGFGPLQQLMFDPEVTDVLVNGPDRVFVEKRGKLEVTDVAFADGRREVAGRIAVERRHSTVRVTRTDNFHSTFHATGGSV
jgi:pilus assembly protein CpaF